MLSQFLIFFSFTIVSCKCLVYYDIDVKGDSQNGYYITTQIGTPAQLINLLLDTGSSNLAVASVPEKVPNTQYFAFNDSRTFHSTNTEVRLRYVQGLWSGFLGTDVFNVCPNVNCSATCNISCMTEMEDIFDENSNFQGILGLAYSSIAIPNSTVRPFLDVFTEKMNTSDVFSLLLCGPFFSSKATTTNCGKFHVGYSDEYTDQGVMYTPIVHEWFYEITVIDLKVGRNSAPMKCHEINKDKSIVDSGTTELNVPKVMFDFIISEIHDHLNAVVPSEFWVNKTIFCMKNQPIKSSLFPTITITLYHSKNSSFDLHISPELYLLPSSNGSINCANLGIGTSSFGIVIGSSVLKGFYVIFDRENKRIGFSKPKNLLDIGFIYPISNLLVYETDFDHCIRYEMPNDQTVSPLLILALIGFCLLVIFFLYALLSWIWNVHIARKENLSDTSSLIEEDDDEQ